MTPSIEERIIAEAMTWAGTPFRHQGSRKGVGCDCLGLVRGVWRAVYRREPELPGPYAMDWNETAAGDPLVEAARRHCVERPAGGLRPGDLLLFRWKPQYAARHAGILVSAERFIHAYDGNAVVVSPLVRQWRGRIACVFAFPDNPKD